MELVLTFHVLKSSHQMPEGVLQIHKDIQMQSRHHPSLLKPQTFKFHSKGRHLHQVLGLNAAVSWARACAVCANVSPRSNWIGFGCSAVYP